MKKIHQIWITENDNSFPEFIESKTNKLKVLYNDYEYFIYNNKDIEVLIKENFNEDVLNAYMMLRPYAFKSDLARYCILYLYGGYYWDISLSPDEKFEFTDDVVLLNGDKSVYGSNGKDVVDNGFMFFKEKNNILLKKIIDTVVENVLTYTYGDHPLDITGPFIMGKILKNVENITYADVIHYTENKKVFFKNKFFFNYKPNFANSDLSKLGAVGTNSYEELWFNNRVFKYKIKENKNDLLIFSCVNDINDFLSWVDGGGFFYDTAINYIGTDNEIKNFIKSKNTDYLFNEKRSFFEIMRLHSKIFSKYEYILLINEDINVSPDNIYNTFKVIKDNQYYGAQWMKNEDSTTTHKDVFILEDKTKNYISTFMEFGMIFLKKDLLMKSIQKYNEFNFKNDDLVDVLISNVAVHNKMLPFTIFSNFSFTQKKTQNTEYYHHNQGIINNNKKFFRLYDHIELNGGVWDRNKLILYKK